MLNCDTIETLRSTIKSWRDNNESVAFVPTMGNLHQGHLSLIATAREKADRVVVSIYVNPLQFTPDEDFESYPRTLDDDLSSLSAASVDLVFLPDSEMIYPHGEQHNSYVHVPRLSDILEGEHRPGFFRGVATVVLKLFNLIQPDYAIFGEKDFQQLLVIRRMVDDLNLPITIISAEIKREPDGLAMSSRNNYLSDSERDSSRLLSSTLNEMKQAIVSGIEIKEAENDCIKALNKSGFMVDYVSLRETNELNAVSDTMLQAGGEYVILVAAKLGKTRLIDNLIFTVTG